MFGLFGRKKKRGKPLVLIIEDDGDVRFVMNTILESMGLDVLSAANGPEGLKLALKEVPDLILCDIRMPGMDGFDVCGFIKSDGKTKDITVIMVTAMDQNKDVEEALARGADGYIAKPLNHIMFKKKIAEILKLPPPNDI